MGRVKLGIEISLPRFSGFKPSNSGSPKILYPLRQEKSRPVRYLLCTYYISYFKIVQVFTKNLFFCYFIFQYLVLGNNFQAPGTEKRYRKGAKKDSNSINRIKIPHKNLTTCFCSINIVKLYIEMYEF